jgi:Holliday junction DNA helicase RuvA
MIGFLRGHALFRDDPYLYIDVSGVGYKVLATREVLTAGADPNKELFVYTFTYVREDILELFGFLHAEDLKLFEKFISISGIGPKTAIQIFSTGSRSEIIDAIISGNVTFFTAVPRLGKKNAQKIILELKGKFIKGDTDLSMLDDIGEHDEVITALKSMGFGQSEITAVIKRVPEGSTEEKLKFALKNLAR